jgi:type 1 fimbria pilin
MPGDSIMNRLLSVLRVKSRSATSQELNGCLTLWRILTIVTCAFGLSAALPAHATCSFSFGSFSTRTIDMGSITVPTNVAVGTVISTKQVSFNSLNGQASFTCGDNVLSTLSLAMSGTGSSGVYPTNIPGIGVRVYAWSSQGYYASPTSPTITPNSWTFIYTATGGAYGTAYLQLRVDLVATGPISTSGTNALSYGVAPWMTVAANDGSGQMSIANLAITATVTTRSCTVTTSSVAVILPTTSAANLDAGSTGTTPFNLSLNCSAGTKVNVTLSDASDISNTSTTLELAPGSTATGVGLRIFNGSTPIAYGPDSATAGNTNQWLAGTAAGGPMNIPLTVQYVRTTDPLTVGTVKGLATFTMSYQ